MHTSTFIPRRYQLTRVAWALAVLTAAAVGTTALVTDDPAPVVDRAPVSASVSAPSARTTVDPVRSKSLLVARAAPAPSAPRPAFAPDPVRSKSLLVARTVPVVRAPARPATPDPLLSKSLLGRGAR